MGQTYEIVKTTDNLSRAVENDLLSDTLEILATLRDDLREYEVDDEAYFEILEEIDKIFDILKGRYDTFLEGIPDNVAIRLAIATSRIDGIYLRNSTQQESKHQSIESLRRERDLYRQKLIRHRLEMKEFIERLEGVAENIEDEQSKLDELTDT